MQTKTHHVPRSSTVAALDEWIRALEAAEEVFTIAAARLPAERPAAAAAEKPRGQIATSKLELRQPNGARVTVDCQLSSALLRSLTDELRFSALTYAGLIDLVSSGGGGGAADLSGMPRGGAHRDGPLQALYLAERLREVRRAVGWGDVRFRKAGREVAVGQIELIEHVVMGESARGVFRRYGLGYSRANLSQLAECVELALSRAAGPLADMIEDGA